MVKEFSDHGTQQNILDISIFPKPYDLNKHLDAVKPHYHKRRMTPTCDDRYLLFMLDTSGSIGEATFTRMVSNLSKLLPLFCGNTKIAAMTFGSHIYHEFCFKCPASNKGQIQDAIKSIPYHGGSTRTGEAIKCACDNILTIPCGLPKRKSYRKCPAPIDVVIITDGMSNGFLNPCDQAKCFHSHPFYDVSTFSIHIGSYYNKAELNCLKDVDDVDDADHIFFDVDNFDDLEKLFEEVRAYLNNTSHNDPNPRLCYHVTDPSP